MINHKVLEKSQSKSKQGRLFHHIRSKKIFPQTVEYQKNVKIVLCHNRHTRIAAYIMDYF